MTPSRAWVEAVGLNDHATDKYLRSSTPFFHSFGYKSGWLACLIAGCTILPHSVFDADGVIHRIAETGVTVLTGAPTLYQSMLVSTAPMPRPPTCLHCVSPSPAPPPCRAS